MVGLKETFSSQRRREWGGLLSRELVKLQALWGYIFDGFCKILFSVST